MHFKFQTYLNFCRKTLFFFLVHKSLLDINVWWLSFVQKPSLFLVLNTEIFYFLVTDCIFTQEITDTRTLVFHQLPWYHPSWYLRDLDCDTSPFGWYGEQNMLYSMYSCSHSLAAVWEAEDATEIYVQGRLLQVETRQPRDFCCLQILY